jgi:hypothetical protein
MADFATVAFGQPAWFTDVLLLLERRIVAHTKLPADRVFAYLGEPDDLLKSPPGEKFIALGIEDLPVDQRRAAGGGAVHAAVDMVVRLDCFARLGTDREFADPALLRDRSKGLGQLVFEACRAVHVWSAADAGKSLLREPSRVLGVRPNPRKPATGWGWCRIRAAAYFRADLSVTPPFADGAVRV